MMETDHLRKVAGYDFHDLRRKYDVRTMWRDLDLASLTEPTGSERTWLVSQISPNGP